jgi:hypothetical protein
MSDSILTNDFDTALAKMLEGETVPPLYWYLVGFIDKRTGEFTGAVIMQADTNMHAVSPAASVEYRDRGQQKASETKVGEILRISPDRLPSEEYLNRLLTPDEVKAIFGR